MSKYDLTLNVAKVNVEYATDRKLVEAGLTDVELDDVIDSIGTNEVLDHITHDDIASYVKENDIAIEED